MGSVRCKPDGTMVVIVQLTFKPGRDDPMIALVRSAPPRLLAAYIREGLRTGTKQHQEDANEEWLDLSGLGEEL